MNYAETTIEWKPVSEYAGGRVLATNGLDIIIGRIDCDNNCTNDEGEILCRITAFALMDEILHQFQKSENERIRKDLIRFVENNILNKDSDQRKAYLAWLEKQGEKNSE